ncbi:hypothetical protein FOZ62_006449, partial [Perkinsus olseni]
FATEPVTSSLPTRQDAASRGVLEGREWMMISLTVDGHVSVASNQSANSYLGRVKHCPTRCAPADVLVLRYLPGRIEIGRRGGMVWVEVLTSCTDTKLVPVVKLCGAVTQVDVLPSAPSIPGDLPPSSVAAEKSGSEKAKLDGRKLAIKVVVDFVVGVSVAFILRVVCALQHSLYQLRGLPFMEATTRLIRDFGHLPDFYYYDSDRSGSISRAELLDFVIDREVCAVHGRGEQALLAARLWHYYRTREQSKALRGGEGVLTEGLEKDAFMWLHRELPLFCQLPLHGGDPGGSSLNESFLVRGRYDSIDSVESSELSCDEYWNRYIAGHRPLVIRDAIKIPGWSRGKWLENGDVGDLQVKLETSMELRGVAKEAVSRMALRELDPAGDWYVVSTLPQAMAWEVEVPRWGHRKGLVIEENGLWISPAGLETRSSFHYDKENVMNCLVAGEGEKLWWFVDTRKYGDILPWVRGRRYNSTNDRHNTGTDWLALDLDAIDEDLHRPWLEKVEIRTAVQRVGDCMVVPYSMLHLAWSPARASGGANFNAAVAWSFLLLDDGPYECSDGGSLPLAAVENVWPYVGYGAVPQGFPDPNELRETTLSLLDNGTSANAREKQWRQLIAFATWRLSKSHPRAVDAFRDFALSSRRNGLSVHEASLDLWRMFAAAMDATDGTSTPSDSFISVTSGGEAPSKPTSNLEQPTETNFSITEISSILPAMNFFVETSTFDLSITPTHSRVSVSPVKDANDPPANVGESPALPVVAEEEVTYEETVPQTSTETLEEPAGSPPREPPQEPISPPTFPLPGTPPQSESPRRSDRVASPLASPIELSDDDDVEDDNRDPLDQTRMDRRTRADPDRRLTSVLLDDGDSGDEKAGSEGEYKVATDGARNENTPYTANKKRELPPYMTLTPADYRHGNNKKDDDSEDDALLTPISTRRRPRSRKKTPLSTKTSGGENDDDGPIPDGDFSRMQAELLKEWYPRMNEQVFDNRLPKDMDISWNNRMLTTAGVTVFKKGVCRIELSTKVLDRPLRVCKTLLHEMCHAAQFILSGELRPPHGPAFKKWAQIASAVFPQYAVTVSHSYEIRAKYSFTCTDCGHKVSRHTKSVNVYIQRCKRCGGRFVQDKKN